MMLDRILTDPLYTALVSSHAAPDGNLLQYSDNATAAAQCATIAWAIEQYAPRPRAVVETGTNKALFGLLLTHVLPVDHRWSLHTIDINPEAARAVAALNAACRGVDAHFYAGDSRAALPRVLREVAPDLAWVDGDHSAEGCLADLRALDAARVPLILVDDATLLPEVAQALYTFLAEAHYAAAHSPHAAADSRGIAVLVRYA